MKALHPCQEFRPRPEQPNQCYWCRWDEVPHLVPEDSAFEATYWETLYGSDEEA